MAGISRRRFVEYIALLGLGAGAAAVGYDYYASHRGGASTGTTGSTYAPPANSTPDYSEFMQWLHSASKGFSGESQKISLEYEFAPLAIQALDLDFLNATGISNQYDLKPYPQHLADISLMKNTSASTYDAFDVDYQDIGTFKDVVLSPDDLAESYPDLTYEKISSSDFWEVPWSYVATYPPAPYSSASSAGKTLFIPFDMSTMIQFYRTDLYQTAGLAPATSWEQYASNAMALKGGKTLFGTVDMLAPDVSVVYEFTNFLSSYGAELWQVDGGQITSGLDSAAALTALETYLSLKPSSDPACLTYSWPDMATDLLRGLSASALQFDSYASWMDEASRSYVVGDMGYAMNPAGPSGSYSTFGGSGVGVSKFSKNPEIAWLWLQWATALGTQETAFTGSLQPFPSRKTVFDNSTVSAALATNAYRAAAVTKGIWDAGQIVTLLPFPKWYDVLVPISFYLNSAWQGSQTPQAALNMAMSGIESWGTLTF